MTEQTKNKAKPLRILTVNDPEDLKTLRGKSERIEIDEITTPAIQELIDRMMVSLEDEKYGVGLAAPQVGKNIRLFLSEIEDTGKGGEKKIGVFINPEIDISDFTQEIDAEGCLSIPKVWGKVARYKRIKVVYFNREGERVVEKFDDFIARLIQHEADHLDGVLFTDKLVK